MDKEITKVPFYGIVGLLSSQTIATWNEIIGLVGGILTVIYLGYQLFRAIKNNGPRKD